jgi:uncharacterized protein YabN with tetrapyrrole methylase and pyrophosphatase domain
VDEVWANWEKIKRAEKKGTRHERASAFDGIPKHLPALLRAEKLVKKARKVFADGHPVAGLRCRAAGRAATRPYRKKTNKTTLAAELFDLTEWAQRHGWSAEELLSDEIKRRERGFRRLEKG